MGGCAGEVHCWDRQTFLSNRSWLVEKSDSMRLLAQVLARLELSFYAPDEVLLVWVEPKVRQGFGISSVMRKTLRKMVRIIKEHLFQRGFLSETTYRLSSIHQLQVLGTTI